MFIFAAIILFYALLMAATKDYKILPFKARVSVEPEDPKEYTFQFSKVMALVGAAIAVGAAVALWKIGVGAVVMVACVVLAIWAGTKIMKKVS